METSIRLSGNWDGAGYSPQHQLSLYPFPSAGLITTCCGDRIITAWTVTASSSADPAYLQVRDGGQDGRLILSHAVPADGTTSYQFPVKTDGKTWVGLSTDPISFSAVSDPSLYGGIFYSR